MVIEEASFDMWVIAELDDFEYSKKQRYSFGGV